MQAGSPWIGREVDADLFRRTFDVELKGFQQDGRWMPAAGQGAFYAAGDVLHVHGRFKPLMSMAESKGLGFRRTTRYYQRRSGAAPTGPDPKPRLAEVVVLVPSGLVGQTLQAARFAETYDTVVLALRRRGGDGGTLSTTPLHAGDVLIIEGGEEALVALSQKAGFLMIGTPARPEQPRVHLAVTLATFAGLITVVSFGLASIVTAAATGCAVLMLTGSLPPREAYKAIDLSLGLTLAGSLALGVALERTGITAAVAQGLAGLSQPYIVLAGFFLVSVLVSELMSNSGTVALLGPMALATATQLGINPMALLAAVTFGSSAAFAMPVGYQTSLMTYGPGGYRFTDFVRMGIVLDLIVAVAALVLIPRYWPLFVP